MSTQLMQVRTRELFFLLDSIVQNYYLSKSINDTESKIKEWFNNFNFSDLITVFTTYHTSHPTVLSKIGAYLNKSSEKNTSLLYNIICIFECEDTTQNLKKSDLSDIENATNQRREKIKLWEDRHSKTQALLEESKTSIEKNEQKMQQILLRIRKINTG